jgi:hypothetical protein
VKFQNDLALTHAVSIKLKHPLKAALIDACAKGKYLSTSLRKDCATRFLSAQLRNPG